jgi:hypothetical protein
MRYHQKALMAYTKPHYSGSWLSEIQEPHPQPPPRKRGEGYDLPHSSAYRYISKTYLFLTHIQHE